MITYCSFANELVSPLKESLAYSLVLLYFSLKWVSLTEYFLVLRALFPLLLQMARCITNIASTACTLRWATTFVGPDYLLALYLN
jgi:hypothetical protein